MAAFRLLLVCCVLLVFPMSLASLPEPGKLHMEFKKYDKFLAFSKALYKEAKISVKGKCESIDKSTPKILTISWKLKYNQCADVFATAKDKSLHYYWDDFRKYEISGEDTVSCDNKFFQLKDESSQAEYIPPNINDTEANTSESKKEEENVDEDTGNKKRSEQKGQLKPRDQGNAKANGKGIGIKEKAGAGQKGQTNDVLKQSNGGKNGGQNGKDEVNETSNENEVKKSSEKHKDGKPQHTNAVPKGKNSTRKGRSAEMKDKILLRVKRDDPEEVTDDDDSNNDPPKKKPKSNKNTKTVVPSGKGSEKKEGTKDGKDGAAADKKPVAKKGKKSKPKNPNAIKYPMNKKSNIIAKANRDGIYMLIVTVKPAVEEEQEEKGKQPSFTLNLDVEMKSNSGYLSATDWPLLPFYGIMSLVYLFYGLIWLIVSACQWRDLLRIQFWIGGVIALGMLEKAVFYSEYNNINNTGITTPSLVVFAEIVSVAKRTLARMLVIIVSMGFGIVKPRLGKSLHRVLGVGALYFIIGIVEGCLRSLSPKTDPSKEQLIAGIPLAVLDAAICWWIFMSLVQTTRTLRIRRNIIKLSLYRHFTNTLIFAVLASVAYMIWSIKTHKFAECMKDWSELWLDDAFWHFLFSIILLVIMVLWRPTANNQRYAFTPIVDFDDDEEDNVTLSEAFEGMKMRNTRTEVIVNGDPKKKAEDDLKWVEENIPSSAADTVLPSVLDSDEELMTTKFEMSKME